MEFKDKLRKLRTEAGLSQVALADIIHISRSAIAKYENGNGKPSEETLKALAFYFGVDVNDLKSDEIIKKESKKTIIKWSTLAGVFLLTIGIITSSTIGIINLINNNRDEHSSSILIDSNPTEIIGVYENIGLYNMDDTIPSKEDQVGSHSYIYTVNTYMLFTIEVLPNFSQESKPIFFVGDIVEFDENYFTFANILYDHSQETRYLIKFRKEGNFEIKYSVEGYDRVIKFNCDNSSYAWNKYQKNISYIFPWIKNIVVDDITSIRYEVDRSSLGPHFFRNIYYSIASNDLKNAYDFLSTKIWYTNINNVIAPGSSTETITYSFKEDPSQSININGNAILKKSRNYFSEKTFSEPVEYYEHRYAFNIYGDEIKAVVISNINREYKLTNFYDIEFVECPFEEGYENEEAVFTISGYIGTEILIYSPNRFSYNDKIYKIVSYEDFSSIFNWYNDYVNTNLS